MAWVCSKWYSTSHEQDNNPIYRLISHLHICLIKTLYFELELIWYTTHRLTDYWLFFSLCNRPQRLGDGLFTWFIATKGFKQHSEVQFDHTSSAWTGTSVETMSSLGFVSRNHEMRKSDIVSHIGGILFSVAFLKSLPTKLWDFRGETKTHLCVCESSKGNVPKRRKRTHA